MPITGLMRLVMKLWYINGFTQAMRESSLEKGGEAPRIGPFRLTGDILKQDGIGGLFRGLTPTFAREMPGYFCFFFAYEFMRELFTVEGRS